MSRRRSRGTACRASPGQRLGYFLSVELSLHLFRLLVGCAFELGRLAFGNLSAFSTQVPAVLFPSLGCVGCRLVFECSPECQEPRWALAFPHSTPAPRPKPRLVKGGGFFIWFLEGPQLQSAFFDEAGLLGCMAPVK